MDNQKVKNWRLTGLRYFGHTKKEIPTEIKVEGQDVDVKVKLKTKRDFEFQLVDGKKEMVPVEKDVETAEYHFKKSDVRSAGMAKKFLWYKTDYVMLVIALIASVFTMGVFLLVGAAYIFFFVRCNHLVIALNSGQEVKIPVSYLTTGQEDINSFLNSLK